MTLPGASNTSHSPSTIPRASSDICMAENTSLPQIINPPALSTCMAATSLNIVPGSNTSSRSSRWLPHIMPIDGSDALFNDKMVNL